MDPYGPLNACKGKPLPLPIIAKPSARADTNDISCPCISLNDHRIATRWSKSCSTVYLNEMLAQRITSEGQINVDFPVKKG